jgi:hypothetical protein
MGRPAIPFNEPLAGQGLWTRETVLGRHCRVDLKRRKTAEAEDLGGDC